MLGLLADKEVGTMLRKILMTLLTLATLLASGSSGSAQEKLRLAWAGVSPTNSPIWVIQEKNYFRNGRPT
jgi:ABC-type nitrate/sulfonate/bicarbonate transport system substrate-binding protein